MIRKFSFVALALFSGTSAIAATDGRIRTLAYSPDQIVRIVGKPGIQSTIEFAPDERIENVAVGDSSAWQITPNHRASLLFVKPLVARSRTNMTVVTDRRTYMFDLVAEGKSVAAVYALKFSYPHDKIVEEPAPVTKQVVAAAAPVEQQPAPATLTADKLHFDWKSKGTGKLVPTKVFDDGTSLYLMWGKDSPLPAILTESEDRKEGPVNYRMSGEYIVINPIPSNLVLRYGSKFAMLWPTHPIEAPARATSNAFEGRIAAAPRQVPVPTEQPTAKPAPEAAAQGSTVGSSRSDAVRLANMTSLYNDKLTDNQNGR
ncbi:MAG TPA: TrbG/VirB9 family P-type conjugative transfer protein [Sphingomicrobium sp.]|nr:TrbG/VirB9 family P-type conjugative transfer protein [Sphingomicrobium sp.]